MRSRRRGGPPFWPAGSRAARHARGRRRGPMHPVTRPRGEGPFLELAENSGVIRRRLPNRR